MNQACQGLIETLVEAHVIILTSSDKLSEAQPDDKGRNWTSLFNVAWGAVRERVSYADGTVEVGEGAHGAGDGCSDGKMTWARRQV